MSVGDPAAKRQLPFGSISKVVALAVSDKGNEAPICLGKEHIKHPCGLCLIKVLGTDEGIQCYDYKALVHMKCASVP